MTNKIIEKLEKWESDRLENYANKIVQGKETLQGKLFALECERKSLNDSALLRGSLLTCGLMLSATEGVIYGAATDKFDTAGGKGEAVLFATLGLTSLISFGCNYLLLKWYESKNTALYNKIKELSGVEYK